MTAINIIKSITVTPDMVTNTNIPETDYAAYNSATTYAAGARVIYDHAVYQSLVGSNVGNTPDTSTTAWAYVSPTNRLKCFDLTSSTQTAIFSTGYYAITPDSIVNSVCLLDMAYVFSVSVTVTHPSFGVVYTKDVTLASLNKEPTWYSWFFDPRPYQSQLILTDLPSYPGATISITFVSAPTSSSLCYVGSLVLGSQSSIADGIQYGARLGIQDYSRKEVNDFGDTVLVKRAYSKHISISALIDNGDLDRVYTLLADLRSTPCVWMLTDRFQSMTFFGYFSNFDITIAYATFADCSIDLESLA